MEDTTSDIQAQIDQLTLAIREWRERQDHLLPLEHRLTELTERCAYILNRWTSTDERHQQAIGELEGRLTEWSAIEHRLEQDSIHRVREFQQAIERDWTTLRAAQDEPAKQLRDQAAALGETCAAAASLALRGFERSEARFAALEQDLQRRMIQLSTDFQSAIADFRHHQSNPALGAAPRPAPFALDEVMRIHDELRSEAGEAAQPSSITSFPPTPSPSPVIDAPKEVVAPSFSSSASPILDVAPTVTPDRRLALWIVAGAALVIAIVAGVMQFGVSRRLDQAAEQVAAAEQHASAATQSANQQAESRASAERQLASTQQAAHEAQLVSGVLAAPDVVRFTLAGDGDPTTRPYGQLLWSRSTGFVLSAARLPAAPSGSVYAIWLLTAGAPVNIGTLVPDGAGRITLTSNPPATAPRPVTGVNVTLEPAGAETAPSGPVVLSHPPQS